MLRRLVIVAVIGMAALQLVPYGWAHPNPPVVEDAPWPSPEARRLAEVACYSCHSNETDWPVYSYVAPMSWLVRNDVENGREELNFSEWDRDDSEADDAAETIADGSMPPWRFTLAHPDAELSEQQEQALLSALATMEEDDGDGDG